MLELVPLSCSFTLLSILQKRRSTCAEMCLLSRFVVVVLAEPGLRRPSEETSGVCEGC